MAKGERRDLPALALRPVEGSGGLLDGIVAQHGIGFTFGLDAKNIRFAESSPSGGAMSLYQVQKMLYQLNRDNAVKARFRDDREGLLDEYDLSEEERRALAEGDIGLLYVLGVNGQILMHFAAYLGIEWFDYLDRMREGVERHGPVRAGVYAMTGGGARFTPEEQHR